MKKQAALKKYSIISEEKERRAISVLMSEVKDLYSKEGSKAAVNSLCH